MSDPKALVQRLVDEVINAGDLDALDDIASPALARALRGAFDQFRTGFPDWHQEIVELVAEADRVVARFRCTGTHQGPWQGLPATGRTMRVDEVTSSGSRTIASTASGDSKTHGPVSPTAR